MVDDSTAQTVRAPRRRVAPGTHPVELERLARQEHQQPEADPLHVQATIWLFRAYGVQQAALADELRTHSLSTSGFNLLMALANSPEHALEPCTLAERLLISRPSVTSLIDTLATRGLVRRTAVAEDRRRVRVELTQAGRHLVTEDYPRGYASADGPLGDLDDEELTTLIALLRKVRGAAHPSLTDTATAPAHSDPPALDPCPAPVEPS